MVNIKICPTCGDIVPRGHGYKTKIVYCSQQCARMRNIPDKTEMLKLLNKTLNITVTAQLLDANKQSLYRWMKYYGINKKTVYMG